jgi:hypothetical protein
LRIWVVITWEACRCVVSTSLLDPSGDLGEFPPLRFREQLGEPVSQHRVQLVPQVVDLRRVADQAQCPRERATFRGRVQDLLAAGQVLAQHLTGRSHVVSELGDDVALDGLDRLRHAGEVRRQFPRQVQHVLGRLQQLLVLDRRDGTALFEPGEFLLPLLDLLVEARHPGHHVRVGVLGESFDRLQQRPDPGLRHPGLRSAHPTGDLQGTDAVGGQPVHLDVVLGHLTHQPPRLHPLPAQVPGVSHRQRLAGLVAVARRPQLVEGVVDLRVGVRHRHPRPLRGEDHRQHRHHERRVRLVEQREHRILERSECALVGAFHASCDHQLVAYGAGTTAGFSDAGPVDIGGAATGRPPGTTARTGTWSRAAGAAPGREPCSRTCNQLRVGGGDAVQQRGWQQGPDQGERGELGHRSVPPIVWC